MDNVKVVPTLDEMISASNTYKRFYNDKAIKRTDAYNQQIDLILTGNIGLNYIQDLVFST